MGDSTASTGDPAHRGWGALLIDYFDPGRVNVVNRAAGGRSFRTYYREGAWRRVVDALKPGDFVVIEFGHNDGGAFDQPPARGDLPGIGDETRDAAGPDGRTETVHTYGWYARAFVHEARRKGAVPILATPTARNIWRNPRATFRDSTIVERKDGYATADDRVERGLGHMTEWLRRVAEQEEVPLLDHGAIIADLYERIGREKTAAYFPADHTHTSTEGARVNAEVLISGLKTLEISALVEALSEKGRAIAPWRRQHRESGF